MRRFNQIIISVCIFLAVVIISLNCYMVSNEKSGDRMYMVEIERTCNEMEELAAGDSSLEEQALADAIDISQRKYIKKIIWCKDEIVLALESRYNYCIRNVNGELYRFEYNDIDARTSEFIIIINTIMVIISVLIICLLLYVKHKLINPFYKLQDLPYELSKGNLSPELKEEESRYFGRFVWGLNLLSENVKERRDRELQMHRNKKLSMLALTHDIKTPLSVIKLNAQAIQKGLYKEAAKQQSAAAAISEKVDEIESYVSQITAAAKDDFLDLSVKEEEFYLDEVIDKIKEHYLDKMSLRKTEFVVGMHNNCLLYGDRERLIEVLQNLVENAVKYGDGKHIDIAFDKEEGCCLISINNTGANVATEEMTKLFDSFYRGSNVKDQPGSGLGLYICRQLMHKMNGDIYLKQKDEVFSATVIVKK